MVNSRPVSRNTLPLGRTRNPHRFESSAIRVRTADISRFVDDVQIAHEHRARTRAEPNAWRDGRIFRGEKRRFSGLGSLLRVVFVSE